MSVTQPGPDAAEVPSRREAVAEALASVRAEGLEPGPECLERLEAIAEGRLTTTEAIEQLVEHYRR